MEDQDNTTPQEPYVSPTEEAEFALEDELFFPFEVWSGEIDNELNQ